MNQRRESSHCHSSRSLALLILVLSASTCHVGECRTLYVSPTGDGTDGTTWAKGFNSISAAYTASAMGDTIHVERGTYRENVRVDDHPITVLGGFAGNSDPENSDTRNPLVHRSIVEASRTQGPTFSIVEDCTVDGIDITLGIDIGGLSVWRCTATIRNCDIRRNGWYTAVSIGEASADFSNCSVSDNRAALFGWPGGVEIRDSSVAFRSCSIQRNRSLGAALGASKSKVNLESCIIGQNTDGDVTFGECNTVIRNCLLDGSRNGNRVHAVGGNSFHMFSSTVYGFANSVRFGFDSNPPPSSVLIENSIFWGANGIIEDGVDVRYSCVQGGYPGEGNIKQNPGFRSLEQEDFRLVHYSPCIDSASTSGPLDDLMGNSRPIDVVGVGRDGAGAFDMGAYEFQLEDIGASSVEGWELYDGSDEMRTGLLKLESRK